jgi:hypothetical protein
MLSGSGYGTSYGAPTVGLSFYSEESFTATAKGTSIRFETTPLTSITRAERMRITPSGNVGIGTTAPFNKLEVAGGGLILRGSNESITNSISFTNPGENVGMLQASYDTTTNNAVIRSVFWSSVFQPLFFQGKEFRWSTGAGTITEKMVLDVNGNVGIGTTAPTAALHLKAGTATLNTAPLKLTAGINLTTPEAGAIEFDGTSLFYTNSVGTRQTLGVAGAGITALSGDVTASGTGSVSATVALVGGVTAANVATGANLANAATTASTANAIVKRDGSGNFTAGTITANVTGNISGTAANVTGIVALGNGGTGTNITTATAGALSYFSSTTAMGVVAAGTAGQMLTSAGVAAPAWTTATYPATVGANNLLFGSATNVVGQISTGNSSILTTGAAGVPAWSTVANTKTLLAYGTAANYNTGVLAGTIPLIMTAGLPNTQICTNGATGLDEFVVC